MTHRVGRIGMRYHGGEMAMAALMVEPSPFWAYLHPEQAAAEFDARQKKYRALAVPKSREAIRPRKERSANDFMGAFADALKDSYGAKLWWSCGGYQKMERSDGRVWIMPPSRKIEAPGNGNRARRRMGQTVALEANPDACPCVAQDCECPESCCAREAWIWRNADGSLAEASW